MKYYAVKRGRTPGIYETWTDCREQVQGYSGAAFKSFGSREEAETFLQDPDPAPIKENLPFAYIDGSYSKKNSCYGYGGHISFNGNTYILQGTGSNPDYLPERNIAGEIMGALQVAFKALKLGIKELVLYYDYAGIENWITGSWRAKTPLSVYYRDTLLLLQNDIIIHFVKVAGHTGIEGNEIADYLAKEAVGAQLRKKDIAALEQFKQEGRQWEKSLP